MCTDVDQNDSTAMLTSKRPVGVTPKVSLRDGIHPGFEIWDRCHQFWSKYVRKSVYSPKHTVKISIAIESFRVFFPNKEVLLRERMKHTARRVASARCTALSPEGGGEGTPSSPNWGRGKGTPVQSRQGVPSVGKDRGTPKSARWGNPPQV